MAKTLGDLIEEARAQTREVLADDLAEWCEDRRDVLVVDVREPYEYGNGHIPGALLIPRGTLEGAADPENKHRIKALYTARDKTVVVCCDTGSRSAMAARTLQEMGFGEVYNLQGGLKMWEAEDLPIADDPPPNELP